VVAHLYDAGIQAGMEPLAAFKATLDRLRGAYALAVLVDGDRR
jgi:glucosamine--fructose-6-phosphate aminotransferase (isomerizing)